MRTGGAVASGSGETHNLSSAGVLFTLNGDVPLGAPIEYSIQWPEVHKNSNLELRCLGKVVRHENGRTIAATVDRYEFVRGSVS